MEVELPIQNMRLVAISEIFVAQTGSMCYNIKVKVAYEFRHNNQEKYRERPKEF